LLAPVPGDKPAGLDLRAVPGSAYQVARDARSAAYEQIRQIEKEDKDKRDSLPPPDWEAVLKSSTKALAEHTKDLEVAVFLIEALVRLHKFAGLRDGFRLARELVDKYWDDLYPAAAEGPAARVQPLRLLNNQDRLPHWLVLLPITDGPAGAGYSLAQYQDSLDLKRLDAKTREQRIKQGALAPEKVEQAVNDSPAKFYRNLVDDLSACLDHLRHLGTTLAQKCGGQAPAFDRIREAAQGCLDTVKSLAKSKLESAAPPPPPPNGEGGPNKADGEAPPAAVSGQGIRTREDAFRVLEQVAEFFRRTEPHTVVHHTLEQVVRWGRMSLPELLTELLPDANVRGALFKQVGIRPPEPPKK
jgi:type VI secretion system protein ImpA